jgi:hypothetical protein
MQKARLREPLKIEKSEAITTLEHAPESASWTASFQFQTARRGNTCSACTGTSMPGSMSFTD